MEQQQGNPGALRVSLQQGLSGPPDIALTAGFGVGSPQIMKQMQQRMLELKKTLQKELVSACLCSPYTQPHISPLPCPPDSLVLLLSLAAWASLLVDCRRFSEKSGVDWWEEVFL